MTNDELKELLYRRLEKQANQDQRVSANDRARINDWLRRKFNVWNNNGVPHLKGPDEYAGRLAQGFNQHIAAPNIGSVLQHPDSKRLIDFNYDDLAINRRATVGKADKFIKDLRDGKARDITRSVFNILPTDSRYNQLVDWLKTRGTENYNNNQNKTNIKSEAPSIPNINRKDLEAWGNEMGINTTDRDNVKYA